MKRKNKKKIVIIVILSILLVVGGILLIGFTSESSRQKRVITNIDSYLKNKSYYGKEAGTEYVMTVTFHNTEEDNLTINFAKENSGSYYLTFKGTYQLYFEGDKLKMEISYSAEQLEEFTFKKELFNVNYNRKGEITSLTNVDEEGKTSVLTLNVE